MANDERKRAVSLRGMLAALLLGACSQPSGPAQAQAVDGSLFAAEAARQARLPAQLREISGLAVSPDGRLFAHNDERAVIYELNTSNGQVVKAFALGPEAIERGDFEGLAITPAGDFWLTTSQGALYRFREGAANTQVAFETFDSGLRQVCEIEGLAYLAAEESLILACKTNEARAMRDTISLHAWRVGGGADAAPWRQLPAADVTRAAGVEHFRPSSLDIDGRTGRLILLSARDAALVEFGADGIASARALGPQHTQAEGAAILADGSLAITDEGGQGFALLSIYARISQ